MTIDFSDDMRRATDPSDINRTNAASVNVSLLVAGEKSARAGIRAGFAGARGDVFESGDRVVHAASGSGLGNTDQRDRRQHTYTRRGAAPESPIGRTLDVTG